MKKIDYTDEERKIVGEYNDYFLNNLEGAIEEGCIQSYHHNENSYKFSGAMYNLAKRILMQVADKRGLEYDKDATYDIQDMVVEDEDLKDFDVELYKDKDALKEYIDNKTKDMSFADVENLDFILGNIMQDQFRGFMASHMQTFFKKMSETIKEASAEENEQEYDDVEVFHEDDGLEIDFDDFKVDENSETAVIDINDNFDKLENDNTEWDFVDFYEEAQEEPEKRLDDEELINLIKYFNSYSKIIEYKENGLENIKYLHELAREKKLEVFYNAPGFKENLDRIMEHDTEKHDYLYHGTQCLEDAKSIEEQGLGMMRNSVHSTCYSEFTQENVILYSRGLFDEIGREAIVVIDQPKDENGKPINIVKKLNDSKSIKFVPSGLQGLNGKQEYIIDSKYIVGIINKKDKKIEYNPKYYDYDRFNNKDTKKVDKDIMDD